MEDIDAVASISDLPDISKTSLSVITPPKVTLGILKTALNDPSVTGIWLQVIDCVERYSSTTSPTLLNSREQKMGMFKHLSNRAATRRRTRSSTEGPAFWCRGRRWQRRRGSCRLSNTYNRSSAPS